MHFKTNKQKNNKFRTKEQRLQKMKELKKERNWSKNEQKNEKMKLREQKKYERTENERMISI